MWIDTPFSPEAAITSRPIPRMLKFEPPKLVALKLTFGAFICRSDGLMICLSVSISPVNALTAIGTSWMLSSVRCEVTTISSYLPPSGFAASSAYAPCVNTNHETAAAIAATLPRLIII